MRVLFTCVVGHGHFNPMVPLAQAFERAGHAVAFATEARFVAHVRGLGFSAFPAGLDQPEAWRRARAAIPELRDASPGDHMHLLMPGLFGGVRVEPMLADLEGIFTDWRPDMLIHDSGEMAGAIAAERAGVPHAEHSFGVLRPGELRRLVTDRLQAVCDRLGVRNPGVGGVTGSPYLDICPPGLQTSEIVDVAGAIPLRPVGFDDAPGFGAPAWLADLPDRPTVYVTLGTAFNEDVGVFRTILDGLQDEELNVIVTIGPHGDPALLGPRPDNVRIERFIPQSKVLPQVSVFINHGGSGALMGAANAAVPVLAIPQGADQYFNAGVIVERGVGQRLLPDELSPDAVRAATLRLLGEDGPRAAIAAVRAGLEAMPSPDEVVPALESLRAAWP